MTPEHLRAALQGLDVPLPGVEEPAGLLRALEQYADRHPTRPELAALVLDAHALTTAGDGLPAIVAGVRREKLIRWDGWTSTWDGPHLATGLPARVRALDARAARDPVLRRALLRAGRAAQRGLDELAVVADEGPWPGLRVLLPGAPLTALADPDERGRPEVLTRALASALAELARWERARIGLPDLSDPEWIDTPAGLRVVCLSPCAPDEARQNLRRLTEHLHRWWGEHGAEGPAERVLAGFAVFPPRSADDASAALIAALAEDLAGVRHRLQRAGRAVARVDRLGRLFHAVGRLAAALPPPPGRGPVGVDLEGRVTVLESGDGHLRWGPADALTDVLAPDGSPEPREARRLLRACAAAPPNPRLAAQSGGDLRAVDQVGRWLAAALQLRTTRLLLQAAISPDRRP